MRTPRRLTVCGSHHRAVHRGELIIEPGGEVGIRFRHADGTLYGQPATPHVNGPRSVPRQGWTAGNVVIGAKLGTFGGTT